MTTDLALYHDWPTPCQLALLLAVLEHTRGGREVSPWYLRETVDIEYTNLAQALGRLRTKGWLRSRYEGRRVYYRLTQAGRDAIAGVARAMAGIMAPEGER